MFKTMTLMIFCLTGMSFFLDHTLAGDIKGNGGDLVYCKAGQNSEFSGYYVLDYLVHASNDSEGQTTLAKDIEVSLTLAEKGLWEIHDELNQFLMDSYQISSGPNLGSKHIWRSSKNGLVDITDELLARKLPKNCYSHPLENKLTLHQVVIRQKAPSTRAVVFNFDNEMLSKIENDITQWSFLMIHEWLWAHCANAECVRNINWYLHSQQFLQDNATDAISKMTNLGFRFNSGTRAKNPRSGLLFSNDLRPYYTAQNEPNGRPQFRLEGLVVIDPNNRKLKLINGTKETLVIHLFEERKPCLPANACEVELQEDWEFPIMFFVEREFIQDPIWDSKVVFLFR